MRLMRFLSKIGIHTAPVYVSTCVFSFLSVVFFILRRMRRKARRYWKANEKRPACSRSYRLRYTCIATGDSPRSSIINVHWVSQVETPKSIYPTAFYARVKCIMRSAIVRARPYARSHTSIKSERQRVGIAERWNFTSVKTDSASRNEDRSSLSEFRQVVD